MGKGWEVGFFDPLSAFNREDVYDTKEQAANRVNFLNGGDGGVATLSLNFSKRHTNGQQDAATKQLLEVASKGLGVDTDGWPLKDDIG